MLTTNGQLCDLTLRNVILWILWEACIVHAVVWYAVFMILKEASVYVLLLYFDLNVWVALV
uniref:Uncharacterized protein n=1 Tax=Manihot esculenta TaxID=3983 RepID=A0A2C9UBL9_MANES